jgi:hypothetical protein
MNDVGRGDARDIGMVVGRCNFDNVGPSEWRRKHRTCDRKLREGRGGADLKFKTYTKLRPARPRMMRLTSRVVQPPTSGVPATNQKECQEASGEA